MLNGKICNTIAQLGGLIVLIAFLSGCKKRLQKEPSVVSINVINPVTEEPISGVKYLLKEYEEVSKGQTLGNNDLIETENNPLATGETDANGNASFQFYKKKDHDFAYIITFDYTQMNLPPGDYDIKGGNQYFLEQHEFKHQFNFEVLPTINFVVHIKNFQCQGPNDEMRYRNKFPHTGSNNWSVWTSGFMGCYEYLSNVEQHLMETVITEIEVTRQDGSFETYMDTSIIGIGSIDTLKVYY